MTHPTSLPARPGLSQGAANWLLVAGLLTLTSLASAWSLRAAWLDLLGTQARGQALQARWAAQAALATGQALLQATPAPQLHALFGPAQTIPCPSGQPSWPAPRWQCARLPLGALDTLGEPPAHWSLQAWLARDVRDAPHIWQLLAQAEAAGKGPVGAQGQLRAQLQVPVLSPAPSDPVGAALWLGGCWRAGTGSDWQICPRPAAGAAACASGSPWPAVHSLRVPDVDGDGQLSAAERQACLALGPAQLPAGGALLAPAPASPQTTTTVSTATTVTTDTSCSHAVWRSLFGPTSLAQVQAWSDAQARSGLHAGSVPPRSVYWVDSPADWGQSLGSPASPVLLVFSAQACAGRCPRLLAGVQIHGTVYLDADCDDRKLLGWQGASIDGLLAIEGGLTQAGGWTRLRGQAYARQAWPQHWPAGPDAAGIHTVPGSRRAGAP